MGTTLISTFTNDDYVTSQLLQIVKPYNQNLTKALLAIINSKLIAFYFKKKYNRQDKTFPEIRIYELASLPIKGMDNNGKVISMLFSKLTQEVEVMLGLNENKQTVNDANNLQQLNQRIAYTDEKINKLVYELYGLSEEEVAIVEGGERKIIK